MSLATSRDTAGIPLSMDVCRSHSTMNAHILLLISCSKTEDSDFFCSNSGFRCIPADMAIRRRLPDSTHRLFIFT